MLSLNYALESFRNPARIVQYLNKSLRGGPQNMNTNTAYENVIIRFKKPLVPNF